jgi:hypothetical protein
MVALIITVILARTKEMVPEVTPWGRHERKADSSLEKEHKWVIQIWFLN